MEWEKIFAIHIFYKEFVFNTYAEVLPLKNKKTGITILKRKGKKMNNKRKKINKLDFIKM